MSSDQRRLALYDAGTLQLIQDVIAGSAITSLVGHGSTIVAAAYRRILRSQSDGPFVDVDISALPELGNYAVQVGDDDTIYAAAFPLDRVEIYRSTASGWQNILSGPPATLIRWSNGFLYVGSADGSIKRYAPASGWSGILASLPTAPISSILDLNGIVYATTIQGVWKIPPAGPAEKVHVSELGGDLANVGSQLFVGERDRVTRLREGSESFDTPIEGTLTDDGTQLYLYGNGIYRFTGTQYSRRAGIGEPATDVALLGSGAIAMTTSSYALTADPTTLWNFFPVQSPVAVAGHDTNAFYVATGMGLQVFDGNTFSPVALPVSLPSLRDLVWIESASTLYAVGDGGLGLSFDGSTWTRLQDLVGCDLRGVAAQGLDVYAVATCGTDGVVFELAGTTWTEVHRVPTPLAAISIDAANNVYAAGATAGTIRVDAVWRDEPHARGSSISATGPTDIWVAGGPDELVRYDGAVWSRVRVVGAASPHVLATPFTVYIGGVSQAVLVRHAGPD